MTVTSPGACLYVVVSSPLQAAFQPQAPWYDLVSPWRKCVEEPAGASRVRTARCGPRRLRASIRPNSPAIVSSVLRPPQPHGAEEAALCRLCVPACGRVLPAAAPARLHDPGGGQAAHRGSRPGSQIQPDGTPRKYDARNNALDPAPRESLHVDAGTNDLASSLDAAPRFCAVGGFHERCESRGPRRWGSAEAD
eukprot:scaffold7099_cov281-Pinguiococcus_pyrenoidosus.AAC.12